MKYLGHNTKFFFKAVELQLLNCIINIELIIYFLEATRSNTTISAGLRIFSEANFLGSNITNTVTITIFGKVIY